MPYCDSCGFYKEESAECEVCSTSSTDAPRFQLDPSETRPTKEAKSPSISATWLYSKGWLIIAFVPVAIFCSYFLLTVSPIIGAIFYTLAHICYLLAFVLDGNHLRQSDSNWSPNTLLWIWVGALSFVFLGAPAVFISSAYIFQRFSNSKEQAPTQT